MNWIVAVSSALASGVEFVEAFTIVLAVGVTRGWRDALSGAAAGVVVLAVLVLVLGVALLQFIPLNALRIAVGVFLLLFGLKWLRKAILRYSGLKALHDEAAAFEQEVATLKSAGRRPGTDWFAFTTSFNGVLLEGLEVVVIVIGLGSGAATAASRAGAMGSATIGAVVAGLLVLGAGVLLRQPLERVPENTMKFIVGVMLTTFGTFWTGEGLGVAWWRNDVSVLPLLAGYLIVSWLAITFLRRAGRPASQQSPAPGSVG